MRRRVSNAARLESRGDKTRGDKSRGDKTNNLEESPAALLSDQEVDRLRIAFEMHADKEEAVVRLQDLKGLLKTLFIVPTTLEMSSLTAAMDPDDTGNIDFGSFFFAITAFMKPQYGRDMLDRAFDEISGGLDTIELNSLQRTMKHLGQSTIRVQDCQAMISEVDREGKGRISREDFQHLQTCTLDNL